MYRFEDQAEFGDFLAEAAEASVEQNVTPVVAANHIVAALEQVSNETVTVLTSAQPYAATRVPPSEVYRWADVTSYPPKMFPSDLSYRETAVRLLSLEIESELRSDFE